MENEGQLYECTREKIIHEDNLINHRIMWAITLNGLLFSAYGFSLMADSGAMAVLTSTATPSQIVAHQTLMSTIGILRQGMVYVGIDSSLAAFVGIAAAYQAIQDDAIFFERQIKQSSREPSAWPSTIGRPCTNIMGMVSGLAVPLLMAAVWVWIGKLVSDGSLLVVGSVFLSTVGLLIWPFFSRMTHAKSGAGEKKAEHATY
jgi:hypothetical protein